MALDYDTHTFWFTSYTEHDGDIRLHYGFVGWSRFDLGLDGLAARHELGRIHLRYFSFVCGNMADTPILVTTSRGV